MWKLPNNAEHCMYKMCFFLLRWKNRCWLTWRLQSVSSSLSRTRRRTSRFIFFGGKWKCLQVKVKVSPTSASLSRTRRRTSPFIFSGESDCWVHVNGKWWHFWQFLTTSTTTVNTFRFQWDVNSCDVYFWKHAYLGSLSRFLFTGWTSCIRIDGAICQMGRVAAALEIKKTLESAEISM